MSEILYSDDYITELRGRRPPPLHPRFLEMMRYLESVAPEGLLPGRQHIDPLDFRQVLTLVNLVDVERDDSGGLRFRYRLVGQEQTLRSGREITGQLVEDAVLPALRPRVEANMRKAVVSGLPVFDSFPMPHPDREFIVSQRAYYPLAGDGSTVDMLLILHDYDPAPAASAG